MSDIESRPEREQSDTSHIADSFRSHELIQENLHYVVIEGVIGAGKTTLAQQLSERLHAQLVLEEFDENPFLSDFYLDRRRWSFHTQLSFLASRFKQQKLLTERDLFHQIVISDYAFEKDRIFAYVNLEGDELQLYESLYKIMEQNTPVPDIIIYLQASPEKLLRNIKKRGRPYEERIERSYLQQLAEAYNSHFFRYNRSPLLIVNTEEVDFVEEPRAVDELLRQIAATRYRGTTYFRPTRPRLFE
ncbi:MAG: deoxynucleoside kinase [Rhodothermales bacterium]